MTGANNVTEEFLSNKMDFLTILDILESSCVSQAETSYETPHFDQASSGFEVCDVVNKLFFIFSLILIHFSSAMFLTSSDRQAIISLCEIHPESRKYDFGKCVAFKSYFVKFGWPRDLEFQRKTQEYVHSMMLDDPSAPRVPSVVDYFTVDPNKAYLVMEFVDGTTPTNDACKGVADALQWLRNVPAPTDAKIGSIGDGPARHDIFLDFRAPLPFTSNEALQNYMNEVTVSTLT
jgi:hypothetical protein